MTRWIKVGGKVFAVVICDCGEPECRQRPMRTGNGRRDAASVKREINHLFGRNGKAVSSPLFEKLGGER